MARKNSNARRIKTSLQSSDMKLQDIQELAAAGVGMGEILSRYKTNSKTFHQFLAKNFGSDEQGKKQLLDRLEENDKKRFQIEKVEEELSSVEPEKPEPRKKPRTLSELRLEAEFLNQSQSKLDDKIAQAENGNQVLSDLLNGYKKQLDETENGLNEGRGFLKKAEEVLEKNQELINAIKEDQDKLSEQVQNLIKETASAIRDRNTIKLVVDTESKTITASNKMELNDEGWQKILAILLDQNRDLVGWQYSLTARLKAILQNHQDIQFEIECNDEAINALIA